MEDNMGRNIFIPMGRNNSAEQLEQLEQVAEDPEVIKAMLVYELSQAMEEVHLCTETDQNGCDKPVPCPKEVKEGETFETQLRDLFHGENYQSVHLRFFKLISLMLD